MSFVMWWPIREIAGAGSSLPSSAGYALLRGVGWN